MTTSVFQLYSSIVVTILSDWISYVDVCFLDAAVCNRKSREHFLNHLSKTRISILRDHKLHCTFGIFEWILNRGIGIKAILLSEWISVMSDALLASSLQHVTVHSLDAARAVLTCPIYSLSSCYLELSDLRDEVLMKLTGIQCLDLRGQLGSNDLCHLIVRLFPNLKRFSACFNSLPIVEGCSELEDLEIPYTAEVVRAIMRLNNIHSLTFGAGLPESTELLDIARKFPNLRKLSVGHSTMTDSSFSELLRLCPLIEHLDFQYFNVGQSILDIAHCHALKYLRLCSAINLDDGIMSVVNSCPCLTTLFVSGSTALSETAVKFVLENCKRLTEFEAHACSILHHAFNLCPTLTSLYIDDIPFSLTAFLDTVSHIEYLELKLTVNFKFHLRDVEPLCLQWNNDIVGREFMNGVEKCKQLREIRVAGQYYAADAWVEALVQHCPLLTNLELSSSGFTEHSVELIAASSLSLARLTLENLIVSDEVLNRLVRCKNELSLLCLTRCMGYSEEIFHYVAAHCSAMESLSLIKRHKPRKDLTEEVVAVVKGCRRLRFLWVLGSINRIKVMEGFQECVKKTSHFEISKDLVTIRFCGNY